MPVAKVTSVAGKTLVFDNGTTATLKADVTLDNVTGTSALVTLTQGTAISTLETSFFEENLIVTTAYDGVDTIGLQVDDAFISSITFASSRDLRKQQLRSLNFWSGLIALFT
ncbi:MAG: hypothetical protein IH831_03135 [Planctomycetes bacterium]|nr:hypothetical protein [Planctomycetota bacterium]